MVDQQKLIYKGIKQELKTCRDLLAIKADPIEGLQRLQQKQDLALD